MAPLTGFLHATGNASKTAQGKSLLKTGECSHGQRSYPASPTQPRAGSNSPWRRGRVRKTAVSTSPQPPPPGPTPDCRRCRSAGGASTSRPVNLRPWRCCRQSWISIPSQSCPGSGNDDNLKPPLKKRERISGSKHHARGTTEAPVARRQQCLGFPQLSRWQRPT